VIATARQSVAPLDHTDPPFTSRAPRLGSFEPALFFPAASLLTVRVPIGERNIFHSHGLCLFFVRPRIKARVGCNPSWNSTQFAPMGFDRRQQQALIAGPLFEHFIVSDDLVLVSWSATTLPNSFGLDAFPLRMISVWPSKHRKVARRQETRPSQLNNRLTIKLQVRCSQPLVSAIKPSTCVRQNTWSLAAVTGVTQSTWERTCSRVMRQSGCKPGPTRRGFPSRSIEATHGQND
jgi:hypothetical protein